MGVSLIDGWCCSDSEYSDSDSDGGAGNGGGGTMIAREFNADGDDVVTHDATGGPTSPCMNPRCLSELL